MCNYFKGQEAYLNDRNSGVFSTGAQGRHASLIRGDAMTNFETIFTEGLMAYGLLEPIDPPLVQLWSSSQCQKEVEVFKDFHTGAV